VLGIGSGCLAQLEIKGKKIIHTKSATINLIKLCFIKYPPASQQAEQLPARLLELKQKLLSMVKRNNPARKMVQAAYE
jgi:hypothetical protein